MTTGELIQQRRKAKGLTQKQLAEMLGVAEITIRQYETNKREPKIDKLSRIADALGAYLGDLIPDWSAYPNWLARLALESSTSPSCPSMMVSIMPVM